MMEIILDVKQRTLKHMINGTSYGNILDDIDLTNKSRLAVTISIL